MTHFPLSSHIQSVRARTEQSDAELLVLDDPDAFAELYDRHVGRILAWSSVRVGDYGADLTAEVFAAAWQSRKAVPRRARWHRTSVALWHRSQRVSVITAQAEGRVRRSGASGPPDHSRARRLRGRRRPLVVSLCCPSRSREPPGLRARTARSALGRGTSLQGDRPAPPMHSRRSSPARFSVAPSSPSGPRRVLT